VKKQIVATIAIALLALTVACGGGKTIVVTSTPQATATVIPSTATPKPAPTAKPTSTPKPAPTATDVPAAVDEAPLVRQLAYNTFAGVFPNASDAWLNCTADYLSGRFPTLAEAATLSNDATARAVTVDLFVACGVPAQ
jgi:hypothetical protein